MVAMLVPDSTAAPAPAVEITVPERSAVISSGIRDIAVDRLAVAAASWETFPRLLMNVSEALRSTRAITSPTST